MKNVLLLFQAIFIGLVFVNTVEAQNLGTEFTFQGKLNNGSNPAQGKFDFEFKLFDALTGGIQTGSTVIKENIDVYDGYFIVTLDFGPQPFGVKDQWLEIGVRPGADVGNFTRLTPRQKLTPTPYALQTRGIFVDDANNVGLGTINPNAKLDVIGSGVFGVYGTHQDTGNYGFLGSSTSGVSGRVTTDHSYGVYGHSTRPTSLGVYGYGGFGNYGYLGSEDFGIFGKHYQSGNRGAIGSSTAGIFGFSFDGFAGHFEGTSYFDGNVGIGTTAPTEELEVRGDVKLSKNTGSLILHTPTRNEPGRYAIRFENNFYAPFLGDETQDQYFIFFTDFVKTRNYNAHIKVHGSAASSWGTFLELTHDGSDGIVATDVGDILLNPATGRVGIGTTTPQSELEVAGTIHSTTTGFKFPDNTIQTTAVNVGASGYIKKLIQNFAVAPGQTVTAGDVVSFLDGYVQKGIAYGDRINYGPKYIFQSDKPWDLAAATLSAEKFVVVFSDYTNAGQGTAIVGEVDGNTITYGPKIIFSSQYSAHSFSVAALNPNQIVISYQDGDGGHGNAIIGNISGHYLTFGARSVFHSGQVLQTSVTALSSTKFVVAYPDYGNSDYGTTVVGIVGGSNIYFGAEYVFNPFPSDYISITALSSNKIAIAYQEEANFDYGVAIIGDISSDVISFGTKKVFNPDATSYISLAALNSTKFVVAFTDGGPGFAMIADVSGNTFSLGAPYQLNSPFASDISVAPLSANQFVVAYDYFSGKLAVGDVVGATISFSSGSNGFTQDTIKQTSVLALSSTKFVVAFQDFDNSDYGTAIVVDPASIMIGIAQETKTAYYSVPVIIDGVSDVHSGLITGEVYYSDNAGDLTTNVTNHRLGLALSPTEILLSAQDNTDQFFGDMIFANNFRITEAGPYHGLILKNQLDREVLNLNEHGDLNITGHLTSPRLQISDVLQLTPRPTPPANPSPGELYYDANDNKLKCYDGKIWRDLW
ncbi:MAG: hypothetical protein GY869_32185 [Planctomycetes bacterium]|nr:hypothetical protein [Planctomycetota bacterium]